MTLFFHFFVLTKNGQACEMGYCRPVAWYPVYLNGYRILAGFIFPLISVINVIINVINAY